MTISCSEVPVEKAAAIIGCPPHVVLMMIHMGQLPARRVGGAWAVCRADADAMSWPPDPPPCHHCPRPIYEDGLCARHYMMAWRRRHGHLRIRRWPYSELGKKRGE